jgi:hypothetical protein
MHRKAKCGTYAVLCNDSKILLLLLSICCCSDVCIWQVFSIRAEDVGPLRKMKVAVYIQLAMLATPLMSFCTSCMGM